MADLRYALPAWLTLVATAMAAEPERLAVQVLDLGTGQVSTVATEPLPGHHYCGSPSFSPDGKRVAFDATPGREWHRTHIVTTDFPPAPKPAFVDFGPGNCPAWSPDGQQFAFLLNAGALPDAPAGIWIANTGGTNRRHVPLYGLPKWSPDGKQLLVASFSNPCQWRLLDVAAGTSQPVALPFHEFFSVPSWTGDPNQLVSVVKGGDGLQVALVNVTTPGEAQLYDVLWTRGQGLTDEPLYPVYAPKQKQLVFVGRARDGCELFTIDGNSPLPRPLEPTAKRSPKIASLNLSPDGRKLLFCRQPTAAD